MKMFPIHNILFWKKDTFFGNEIFFVQHQYVFCQYELLLFAASSCFFRPKKSFRETENFYSVSMCFKDEKHSLSLQTL